MRRLAVVVYVLAIVAVVVGIGVVIFRNRFWARLTVNLGIVLNERFLLAAPRRMAIPGLIGQWPIDLDQQPYPAISFLSRF
jgi:hypothetical protein